MDELWTGIYSAFTGNAALSGAVTNGLFMLGAEQDTRPPYGVVRFIPSPRTWDFDSLYDVVPVEFRYVSSDMSGTEIVSIYDKHMAVYEYPQTITVTGYQVVSFCVELTDIFRDYTIEPNVLVYLIQHRAMLRK